MRDTEREREAETQAEGEAGFMQGARCGTPSRVPRITPQAAGGAKPLRHQGCPGSQFFVFFVLFCFYDSHRVRERGRDTGRGRSRLHAGSPMWDSIQGLQDHTLG